MQNIHDADGMVIDGKGGPTGTGISRQVVLAFGLPGNFLRPQFLDLYIILSVSSWLLCTIYFMAPQFNCRYYLLFDSESMPNRHIIFAKHYFFLIHIHLSHCTSRNHLN
jgi:hypothetical protein